MFGCPKKAEDPRFLTGTAENMKKCYTNFAVFQECLKAHQDPKERNRVCQNFQRLAKNTCITEDVSFFFKFSIKNSWNK
jgi:hypothetical protein